MVPTEPLPEPPEPEKHHQPGQRSGGQWQDPPPAGYGKHIPVVTEECGAEYGLAKVISAQRPGVRQER